MSDGSERREFLKTAGAALGGITIAAVASSEPAAAAKVAGDCKPARTLTFRCAPNIKIDNLFEAIRASLRDTGCTACGLLGIDLNFYVGDPIERLNVQVPGIEEANSSPRD